MIGALVSFPHVLFFFAVWIVASLARPLLVVSVAYVLITHPAAAWRKLQYWVTAILYLIFTKDKQWKIPNEDPRQYFKDDSKIESKAIIFIRHGESTWNETFNKGSHRSKMKFIMGFVPNLLYALAVEYFFWLTGRDNDSWFYDSPLSELGKRQSERIHDYLEQSVANMAFLTPSEQRYLAILRGSESSQLVSSNLRRAISTLAIGLRSRWQNSDDDDDDKIMILSDLQEISRNPDALSVLTSSSTTVHRAFSDPVYLRDILARGTDLSQYHGQKSVQSTGLQRLQSFSAACFESITKPHVIAVGHSLYFRSFFQMYLPYDFSHVAKKKKMTNGSVVAFTLQRTAVSSTEYRYMIDPTSIVTLHGGF
jgi:broad specificity phosphatase PhoE